MPKGLPKIYIKKYGISKEAWRRYRAEKGAGKVRLDEIVKRTPKRKGGGGRVAKKRRRGGFTIPIAPVVGLVAPLGIQPVTDGEIWSSIAQDIAKGDYEDALKVATLIYTGWNYRKSKFDLKALGYGYGPLFLGFIIHWVAGKIGINRTLGRAKIPVVRV